MCVYIYGILYVLYTPYIIYRHDHETLSFVKKKKLIILYVDRVFPAKKM